MKASNMKIATSGIASLGKSSGALLTAPGRFFSHEDKSAHWLHALLLLTLSSLLASGASQLFKPPEASWLNAGLFVFNAIGIVVISTLFGFLILRIIPAVSMSFGRVFSIYAFAGSLPILISWIPGAILLTEAWKWWLIGIGLTRGGLLWWQVAAVIVGSFALTMLFLSSLILLSR